MYNFYLLFKAVHLVTFDAIMLRIHAYTRNKKIIYIVCFINCLDAVFRMTYNIYVSVRTTLIEGNIHIRMPTYTRVEEDGPVDSCKGSFAELYCNRL